MNLLPGGMAHVEEACFRFLERLMVFLLSAMVLMVFGNVVLRWTVDSGIDVSEETSRFFFVWLTFIGAIGLMVLMRILRAFTGNLSERELAIFAGTFEHDEAAHIKRGLE